MFRWGLNVQKDVTLIYTPDKSMYAVFQSARNNIRDTF